MAIYDPVGTEYPSDLVGPLHWIVEQFGIFIIPSFDTSLTDTSHTNSTVPRTASSQYYLSHGKSLSLLS
jgi:hypothetical protein